MIGLKAFLDKLAGPDHPFTKGAPVEGINIPLNITEEEKKEMKVSVDVEVKLNKFLRVNTN